MLDMNGDNDSGKEKTRAGSKGRLVIVDDDAGMQSLLSEVFTSEGYSVTTFSDGPEALSKLAQPGCQVDAVVCDLNMPRMNGLDFLVLTRNFKTPPPTIIISAFGTQAVARDAFGSGAFAFLAKPFQLTTLSELIRRAVSGQ